MILCLKKMHIFVHTFKSFKEIKNPYEMQIINRCYLLGYTILYFESIVISK